MSEDVVKDKIYRVIVMLRKEYRDVPSIIKYRKFNYQKELNEDDIW